MSSFVSEDSKKRSYPFKKFAQICLKLKIRKKVKKVYLYLPFHTFCLSHILPIRLKISFCQHTFDKTRVFTFIGKMCYCQNVQSLFPLFIHYAKEIFLTFSKVKYFHCKFSMPSQIRRPKKTFLKNVLSRRAVDQYFMRVQPK